MQNYKWNENEKVHKINRDTYIASFRLYDNIFLYLF